MSQHSEPYRLDVGNSLAPTVEADARGLAGWASLLGGVLLGFPFVRGIAGDLQVPVLQEPGVAPLAIVSMAAGALVLALGLIGWWRLAGPSVLGRTAMVGLGIGLVLWCIDEVMLLAPDAVHFPAFFGLYLALVGLGSLGMAIDLRRLRWLPRAGLVLVGLGGLLSAGLLGAPWPLGLGAVVPATAVLYAAGWITLGLGVLQAARRDNSG